MSLDSYVVFSSSEHNCLKKIIHFIDQGQYVFLLGAKGMGKTTILKKAMRDIENYLGYDSYYFDIEDTAKKGSAFLYEKIIEKVHPEKKKIELGSNPSRKFVSCLDQYVSKSTLLVFDNLNTFNREFYDHFSQDCRTIFNGKRAEPDSGLSKILIIFGGFFQKSEKRDTSPLWNITEQIEILPIPEDEWQDIIISHFEAYDISPPESLINHTAKATSGHHYLIVELIKFICESWSKFKKTDDHNLIIDEFIEYIWSFYSKPRKEFNAQEKT